MTRRRRRGHNPLASVLRLLVLGVLLGAVLWGMASIEIPFRGPRLGGFDTGRNAIWLAHTWVGEEHSRSEIEETVDALAARRFRYLYVHSGPIEADGTVPSDRYRFAAHFVSVAKGKHPELVELAWLGGLNRAGGEGDMDLSDGAVRQNIVATARRLVVEAGWDGIQLDIEPLPTGRADYLALLDELRRGLPSDKYLSVAAMRLWPLPLPVAPLPKLSEFNWDRSYLRAVAARVNQLAVMTYDSALPTRNLFIQYQRLETMTMVDALAGDDVSLLIGVPTYSDQRPNFHLAAENMRSGLQGVIEGLDGLDRQGSSFAGVAIYAHWTTSEEEWRSYERMWLGRP